MYLLEVENFWSVSELLRAVFLDQCLFTVWSIRQNYLCTPVCVCVLARMCCYGMLWRGNDFLLRWLKRQCSWTVRVFKGCWLRISAWTPTVVIEMFVVFLTPSKSLWHSTSKYLNPASIVIFFKLLFSKYPTIRHCVWDTGSVFKQAVHRKVSGTWTLMDFG